jgi:hypothetical protein
VAGNQDGDVATDLLGVVCHLGDPLGITSVRKSANPAVQGVNGAVVGKLAGVGRAAVELFDHIVSRTGIQDGKAAVVVVLAGLEQNLI